MALVPLREHYSSDEDYQRELGIYLTGLDSDVENTVSIVAASDTSIGVDDEAYPTVGDIRVGYQERYLATRYGTSATGANFTDDYNTIVGLTVFQGLRNSNTVTESTNPAEYTWRELNVATGWIPSYRIAGGRLVDWDFSTTTPTNYVVDNIAGAIDLDNFASGATGAPGQSAYALAVAEGFVGDEEAWIISLKGDPGTSQVTTRFWADDENGTNASTTQGTRRYFIDVSHLSTVTPGTPTSGYSLAVATNGSNGNTVARFEVFIESQLIPTSIINGSYNLDTGAFIPPTGWSGDIPDGTINVWRAVGNLNTNNESGIVAIPFIIDSTVAYANGLNGIDGNTSFQDIAFAANDDGTSDFSFTPSDARRYEGVYTYSASAKQDPQSTTPTDYVWREIRPADSEIAATQTLVSYSNGLVFVRAPNNGAFTPAPVSNEIISRVDVVFQTSEGSSVLARVSRNVVYNTSTETFSQATVAHPSGDLNTSRITVTPTITANSVEFSFEYSHDGRQANTEAEVFLVQGGGVGPANIQRFRIADDAGDAGRPTAASGLDSNWTDNPDLLEAGTLFESTQQVSVSQDGRPYSTDLVFSGVSGGAYAPAQPEIQTITVDSAAQTSTNNPGTSEIIRFTPSGTPGTDTATNYSIPIIFSSGFQSTYEDSVVYQSGDTTSALLADRFVSSVTTKTFEYSTTNSGSPGAGKFAFNGTQVYTDWNDITDINFNGSLADDFFRFSTEIEIVAQNGTARFSCTFEPNNDDIEDIVIIASTGVPPSVSGEEASFTIIERSTFSIARDGDDVVITSGNVGDVTGNLVLTTTQNGGSIAYSTPVVTEGSTVDNASDVTLRFENNDGNNQDLAIIFTSQLNANGIASAISDAINSDSTSRSETATLVYDNIDDSLISNSWAFGDSDFVNNDTVIFVSDWPETGFIRIVASDTEIRNLLVDNVGTPAGVTISFDDNIGNSATYLIDTITLDPQGFSPVYLEVSGLSNQSGRVPDNTAQTTTTVFDPAETDVGFAAVSSDNVVTLTSEENEPRVQTTVQNVDAGTNGNITSGSFTITTTQDGVVANTVVTGTRSSLVVNGAASETITIPPGTNLATSVNTIASMISENTQEMYITGDTNTIALESYSRALGGNFNFTATFNPGDSSTASMNQTNEVSGINEVHNGTQVRWSRAIQVGTIQ